LLAISNKRWQNDVLQCSEFRQEKITLKNKSHPFVSNPRIG